MRKDGVCEWSVLRPAFVAWLLRRGLLGGWTALYIAGFLVAGFVVVASDSDPAVVLYALLLVVGTMAGIAALSGAFLLAVWAVGYGYSYRLDADGLSLRFFVGRAPPPPNRVPDGSGAGGAFFGLFGGWAFWTWAREQGMELETENGCVILRSGKDEAGSRRAPDIFLFCGDGERLAAVAEFIGERLG